MHCIRVIAFAASIALVLVASGCGSNESESTEDNSTAGLESTSPSPRESNSTADETLDPDIVVDLCPVWDQGEKRRLVITETKDSVQQSGPDESSGSVHLWTLGKTEIERLEIDDVEVNPNDLQQATDAFSELVAGIAFELELDQCGVYLGIRNWEEIATQIEPLLLAVLAEAEEREGEAVPEESKRQLLEQFTSQNGIEALIGDDVAVYYGMFGDSYSAEPQFYDYAAPNPFGGEPIPGEAEVWLDDYDAEDECGTIRSVTSYDADELERILQESVQDLVDEAGATTGTIQPAPEDFALDDEFFYEFCDSNPWLTEVRYERFQRTPDGSVRENVVIADVTD
jgi:hypothetical protein